MTTFRQISPNSSINTVNEKYEYYLTWLSPNGGIRSWFFSSTDGDKQTDYELFTIEGQTDIRSVPSEKREAVEVTTKSLESEEFDYIRSIMESNRVYQVNKDATRLPIAIVGGSIPRPNKNKEFEISIKFVYKEDDILNV